MNSCRTYFYIQFNGIIDCWRKTIQQNGFLAIYSGMSICLIGDVVYRGLKYTFYDFLKVSSLSRLNINRILALHQRLDRNRSNGIFG